MGYYCVCDKHHLFTSGCTCGAFKDEQRDLKVVQDAEVRAAKERLRQEAIFLGGEIPKAVEFTTRCQAPGCGHKPDQHMMRNWQTGLFNACDELNCSCVGWTK